MVVVPVDGSRVPRWQRRKNERPGEILTAALEVFVERGFRASRLEDVATRAGVSKGTVYLYFKNKDALFVEVVQRTISPFLTEAEESLEACTGTSGDLLVGLTRRYWSTLGSGRMAAITWLLHAEGAHFPELSRWYAQKVLHRARRLGERILERGIERGEFRPMDATYVLECLFAVIDRAAMARFTFRHFDEENLDGREIIETQLEVLLRGIAADTVPSPLGPAHTRHG